jgi:primosomal protein N' (replication factor Y)
MDFMPRIARVVVEIAVDREFDYLIPERLELELQVGSQVVVPFGRSEARGYVVSLSDQSDVDASKLKEIRDRVGKKVLIEQNILDLARWIADYYCAPVEAAVRTVLPSAVRKKGAGFKERLMVFPTDAAMNELAVEELRKRAPKQAAALDVLLGGKEMFLHHLARVAGTTTGTIRTLDEKGFVQIRRGAIRRDPMANQTILRTQPLELMPQQADALKMIKESVDTLKPPVILLYGVTGSGKTEVYLQAIQYAMDKGKGAILLVQEISLTPQTL